MTGRFRHITSAVIALALGGLSCTERIELDLDTAEPILIIEGSVSNTAKPQIIRVSQTIGYFDARPPTPVEHATVTVSDTTGIYDFPEFEPGVYLSSGFLAGVPGREYTLTVETGGKVYTATSVMPYPPKVDSINFSQDPEDPLLYHIRLYAPESPTPGDHYLFGVYRESIYLSDNLTKKTFASDRLINGKYLYGLPVQTVEAKPGARITLQVASIPQEFFEYCLSILRVTVYNDNPFEQAPANVQGNISGHALGFFYTYAETETTKILRVIN